MPDEMTFEQIEEQRKAMASVIARYAAGAPDDMDNPAAWAALHAHNERIRRLRAQGIRFKTELLYDTRGRTAVRRIAAFQTSACLHIKLVEKFLVHDGSPQEGQEMTESQAMRFRNRDGKIMGRW